MDPMNGKTSYSHTTVGSDAWEQVEVAADALGSTHLRDLFVADPSRAARFTYQAGSLRCDLSKHWITTETLGSLLGLVETAHLREAIDSMFSGERFNITEDRAVLHTALRAPALSSVNLDGHDVVLDVHKVLAHMKSFANRVRSGEWIGATGKRIRNVVNIGIGGSDLGPAMAYEALKSYSDRGIRCRFVSLRSNGGSRPRRNTLRRKFEDLYDHRDDYQCDVRSHVANRGPR
jgi:glucose-6-phosphate isomerase